MLAGKHSSRAKDECYEASSEGSFAGPGLLVLGRFFLRHFGCDKRFDVFYKIYPDLISRIAELVWDERYN
jgi:hypothetical protein